MPPLPRRDADEAASARTDQAPETPERGAGEVAATVTRPVEPKGRETR